MQETLAVRRAEIVVVVSWFVVLTVLMTFPQVTQLGSHIGVHYDALFSVWRLAWIAHQLTTDPLRLFDGNIFFPETNTLAYSDGIMALGLAAAPALWAGVSPLVAYNTLVLLSFVTAGSAMYLLARDLTQSRISGLFAGSFFAFHPYRLAHFPQLELLWTCCIPLALWSLHRLVSTRETRYGLLLGASVVLQVLTCLYYAVFLITVLPIFMVIVVWGGRVPLRALWKPTAAALAAVVVIAPYSLPYLENAALIGQRRIDDAARWSATPQSYLSAQAGNWLYPLLESVDPFEGVLFPGVVTVVLAAIGLASARPRYVPIAYAVVLVVALDLSLGVNGFLYEVLFSIGGPYRGLRVPARFFVIVATALAVLSALGMRHVRSKVPHPALVASVALMVGIAESASLPLTLNPVPETPTRLYAWLAAQPRSPVFEWPVPRADALGVTQEPRYMYYSTLHWQPLVNGYSGNYPHSYIRLLESLERFPDERSLEALRLTGVRYLVLHSQPDPQRYVDVVAQLTGHRDVTFELAESTSSEEVALYVLREDRASQPATH